MIMDDNSSQRFGNTCWRPTKSYVKLSPTKWQPIRVNLSKFLTIPSMFNQLPIRWLTKLFYILQFAYNKSIHSSMRYTSYFASIECHFHWTLLEHQEVSEKSNHCGSSTPNLRNPSQTFTPFVGRSSYTQENCRSFSLILHQIISNWKFAIEYGYYGKD